MQGSGGVDTALLYEAHGLVTEMLLDQAALPANIVAGLKALATLLKPTSSSNIHYSPRPKPVPLTLSIDPDYTSDIDEIPYTGEKISTIPKVKNLFQISVPRLYTVHQWICKKGLMGVSQTKAIIITSTTFWNVMLCSVPSSQCMSPNKSSVPFLVKVLEGLVVQQRSIVIGFKRSGLNVDRKEFMANFVNCVCSSFFLKSIQIFDFCSRNLVLLNSKLIRQRVEFPETT